MLVWAGLGATLHPAYDGGVRGCDAFKPNPLWTFAPRFQYIDWLVVSSVFLFSIIYGIILPIDYYFSRLLKPPTS
jgi:hypothetical protein